MTTHVLFDFNKNSDLQNWVIVDDVVMGGESSGSFGSSSEGYGIFKGSISLDNNGGFSSVRYQFERKIVKDFTKIILKIKGDSKNISLE